MWQEVAARTLTRPGRQPRSSATPASTTSPRAACSTDADPSFPQWARAKGCDTFCPCGPAIVTGLDWSALQVCTLLNGRERQSYPAADMILPPARIVSLLSREMTLEPGNLIACGTSIGVLPMRPGMEVIVVIDGIGTLTSRTADAA